MLYFKSRRIWLNLFYLCSFVLLDIVWSLAAFSYRSDTTSIIGIKSKQSLLDRNYIFENMTVGQRSNQKMVQEQLNKLSDLPKLKNEGSSFRNTKVVKPEKVKYKKIAKNNARASPKSQFQLHEGDSWGEFEAIYTEDLAVKAVIK